MRTLQEKLLNQLNKRIEGSKIVNNFTLQDFTFIKARGKKPNYCSRWVSFDSETSHIKDICGWVYSWCAKFGNEIVLGRTPRDFLSELFLLEDLYKLNSKNKIVVYIHNLSYDITYLIDFLNEYDDAEVFAIQPHKILSVRWRSFEFRCSYLLSNMSLDKWSEFLNTKNRKMVGAVDYTKIRYQDDDLTEIDWLYQIFDVITMDECLEKQMSDYEDNVQTIPLTSTGYVRRDCRIAMRTNKQNRKDWLRMQLTPEVYRIARLAFMGGYCHGNRFLAGKTICGNIEHYDFKSHYPSRMLFNYFPDRFVLYANRFISLSEYLELSSTYCVLAEFYFKDLRLRKSVTAPYLSKSKILNFCNQKFYKETFDGCDNGKIVNMDGVSCFALTELDFEIVAEQYTWTDLAIHRPYIAKRIKLAKELVETMDNYFKVKETESDKYIRMKDKNKLNAIYGMIVTDPVRDECTYIPSTGEFEITKSHNFKDSVAEKLEKYYKNFNNFLTYTQGIYVTAWARYYLFKLIKIVGYKNFIYADTDSIFFISNAEIIEKLNTYNLFTILDNEIIGSGVLNKNGGYSYYGVFEDEKDNIRKFRFLHAKCYAYEDANGELHATIAGVSKSNKKLGKDKVTIEDELKSIENLDENMIFKECGGTRCVYTHSEPQELNFNGHETVFASAAIILPTDKKLSVIEEYEEFDESEE